MKEILINIPIFEDEIILWYGTDDELYNKWQEINPELIDQFNPVKAKYWSIYDENNNLIRYVFVIKKIGESYVYHESLHATNDILAFHGVKVHNDNDEIQCLLMDYIAKEILKEIK